MSKIVHEFSNPVPTPEGVLHTARVLGEQADGHWHGSLEFTPHGGGPPLRTGRETSQTTYEQLEYWASGLSPDYLDMAFRRATPVEQEKRRRRAAP